MIDDVSKQTLHLLNANARLNSARLQVELADYWQRTLDQPRYRDSRRLLRHGFKVYSQFDEDGILQEIFRRIGTTGRKFVEFGVGDGSECNTVKLLVEGWSGLWIEGNPRHALRVRERFAEFTREGRLNMLDRMVTAENIDGLLAEGGSAGEIDLLSIDIDGNDYWVWKAISTVNPRAVVIEYNATIRPPASLVVPYEASRTWDGTNYFGASLAALVRLAESKGYRIVGCSFTGANAFFVRSDLCADRFLEPATADEHYEPPRYFMIHLAAGHRARPGRYEIV